jgi:hypothetical protein
MSAVAVFVPDGDRGFVTTDLARGPWDPEAQHGGAPAGLLMRAFETLPASDELAVARVTYEFLRPVPLGQLEVRASVPRPGRRVQLLEASIFSTDGNEVVRARALQVRRAEADQASVPSPPPPGPEEGVTSDYSPMRRPTFGSDPMEIRFVARPIEPAFRRTGARRSGDAGSAGRAKVVGLRYALDCTAPTDLYFRRNALMRTSYCCESRA